MATYYSERMRVAAPPASVFAKLSDLSHLQHSGNSHKVETTADSVAADLPMVGKMTLRVVERVPNQRITLQAENAPLPLTVALHIEEDSEEGGSWLQLSLDAPLNPFMQSMVERPIKEALAKMSERVKQLTFNEV